jgi:hypothetical protein
MHYSEIVYVLTNPAMPGMVKIGRTNASDVNARMNQLYKTSVPVQFECAYAKSVENASAVEAALHKAFAPNRVNPRREFFSVDPEQPVAMLQVFPGNDVTPSVNDSLETDLTQSERASANRIRRQRPPMNFLEMGIPAGSTLTYQDGITEVIVVNGRKVQFGDDIVSLTKATRDIRGNEYNVQPAPYWYYQGELLSTLYDRTYVYDE